MKKFDEAKQRMMGKKRLSLSGRNKFKTPLKQDVVQINVEKVDNNILPNYINQNLEKYKDWIE